MGLGSRLAAVWLSRASHSTIALYMHSPTLYHQGIHLGRAPCRGWLAVACVDDVKYLHTTKARRGSFNISSVNITLR